MGKEKKLKNQRFGRLVVVEKIGVVNHRVLWKCVCDCGNECNATSHDLSNGNKKSCGCLKKNVLLRHLKHMDFQKKGYTRNGEVFSIDAKIRLHPITKITAEEV